MAGDPAARALMTTGTTLSEQMAQELDAAQESGHSRVALKDCGLRMHLGGMTLRQCADRRSARPASELHLDQRPGRQPIHPAGGGRHFLAATDVRVMGTGIVCRDIGDAMVDGPLAQIPGPDQRHGRFRGPGITQDEIIFGRAQHAQSLDARAVTENAVRRVRDFTGQTHQQRHERCGCGDHGHDPCRQERMGTYGLDQPAEHGITG